SDPQPMVYQVTDSTGAFLDPPIAVDTTQPYIETSPATNMSAITVDGTNFLYAQDTPFSGGSTHFYTVPIAGGPAMHIGTNDNIQSVSAIAADSTYIYVISRAFGGGQESEGIYRLRRDQLSDSTAIPELVYGGGHNWNDGTGALFLDSTGSTQWLYFRTYNPAHIHMLLNPGSATPRYLGPLWTQTTNNQTGMGYDPATPALFFINHDNSQDRWMRLD